MCYTSARGPGRILQKRDGPRVVLLRSPQMMHDLVLALVFLAMIITPALLAMRSDREENDVL